MPVLQQAQQLKDFAEEIFELSKDVWAVQSRARQQAEITETEFLALDILSRQQPQSVGEIQRQIGILPAQMSRIIRALESKGDKPLIACRINPQDKRKIDVEMTAAGREAYKHYRQVKLGSIEKMLLSLDEHDRNELVRIMRQLRQTIHKPSEDQQI